MSVRIIHTDNFGGDYPNEKFVEELPLLTLEHAERIAKAINDGLPDDYPRFYKAVPDDYQLAPAFEP